MKKYAYQNGISENEMNVDNSIPAKFYNTVAHCNYVTTTDGEHYIDGCGKWNDKELSCYKVVTLKNGERRNVNMNNGIAYKTTL